MDRKLQICANCVMDSNDPDVYFDLKGVCNYCHQYYENKDRYIITSSEKRKKVLDEVIERIRKSGQNHKYDCVIGLSGGVDSSYLAVKVKEFGLRPLAVHLDNGWNSELAVNNIEIIMKKLGLDLYSYVVDWDEFSNIQRSYLKASVVDIEVVTDQAITAALYKVANENSIKFIIGGSNYVTEALMPPSPTI